MRQVLKILSIVFLGFFLLLPISGKLKADTVVLSASDFPPFEFAEPKDGLPGFNVEVIKAAFKRVNISTEFKFFPWKRALEQTKLGLYAGIFSCTHRPEREDFFLFSDQLSQATLAFFIRQDFDGFEPSSLQDAKGLRVATVLGWSQVNWLKDVDAKVVTYRSEELVFKNLLKGVVDYAFLNKEGSEFRAMQLGLAKEMRILKVKENKIYICFSKKWPNVEGILARFNDGLAQIKQDGTYKKIHDKYR